MILSNKKKKKVPFPKTPIVKVDKDQTQLGIMAAKVLNWNFSKSSVKLKMVCFFVPYDKITICISNNRFFEQFVADLEELVSSRNQLDYFKSNLVHLHNYNYIIKVDMKRIGERLGVKLNKKKPY